MEVRKDFGRRVAASVKGIPPEAIGMLLKAVLPKTVPIKTKAPAPRGSAQAELPAPHMKAPSKERAWPPHFEKKKGAPKTRKPRVPRWNILRINSHTNHKVSTDRHWMAKAATWCAAPPTGPRNAFGAQNLLNEWGVADIKLDIPWLVRQGYIELVEGEE